MLLLVDDDPDLRDAIQQQLEVEGYAVITAGDRREALEQLERHGGISLILADLKMPTMDGRQLLQALQRQGNGSPAVVLLALADVARSELTAVVADWSSTSRVAAELTRSRRAIRH